MSFALSIGGLIVVSCPAVGRGQRCPIPGLASWEPMMRLIRNWLFIVVAGAVSAAGASAAPADDARLAVMKKAQEQQRTQQEKFFKSVPLLPDPLTMSDIFQLTRKGDSFSLTTSLPKAARGGRQVRVEIKGLRGTSLVQVNDAGRNGIQYFNLNNFVYDDEGAFVINTNVNWSAENFSIGRSSQLTAGGADYINFSCQLITDGTGKVSRQYVLNANANDGKKPGRNINVTGPDLASMRRED